MRRIFLFILFFVTINRVFAFDFGIDSGVEFEVGAISDAELVGERMRSKWQPLDQLPKAFLDEPDIRQLKGKHIILYTDVKSCAAVDNLPQIFDQMVSELCVYFGLDLGRYDKFFVRGFLIDDMVKFSKYDVLGGMKELRYGYSLRNQIWVRYQSTEYYQRHLFLHEGVHAFMFYAFGKSTPFWYCEGMAEMLATHKIDDGKLRLGCFPSNVSATAGLGRIETIQRLVKNFDAAIDNKIDGKVDLNIGGNKVGVKVGNKIINDVKDMGVIDVGDLGYLFSLGVDGTGERVELYAMCWGFVMFCDNHPRYRAAFRRLAFRLTDSNTDFARRFIMLISCERKIDVEAARLSLEVDWNDFRRNICYGYDFSRAAIDFNCQLGAGANLNNVSIANNVTKNNDNNLSSEVVIRADRGWQCSGLRLEANRRYNFTATGSFQLADKPAIWKSEANGITIKYNQGAPVGKLCAMIISDVEAKKLESKLQVLNSRKSLLPEYKIIGANATWKPQKNGLLFLKINDPANSLKDNNGNISVKIQDEKEKK
ncbi:MAG: hypothetical protein LBP59_17135 [Planctomycetaceae bacterium]|jgi:hypothetical protein|nr:hypothetical protein [Planctomycetaceae bacterium]